MLSGGYPGCTLDEQQQHLMMQPIKTKVKNPPIGIPNFTSKVIFDECVFPEKRQKKKKQSQSHVSQGVA